jgi:YbbR domain-containing protein
MKPINGRKLLLKITENWPAKALSLALAIGLFVFHRMSVKEDRFFSVPLKMEINNALAPANSYPHTVRVKLSGEASSIHSIAEEDIEAYLDLTRYHEKGTYRVPVQIHKKDTALGGEPAGISIDPPQVVMELDEKISRYVPLKPNFGGYPESGYEMVSYTLIPPQVVVDGPKSLVEQLSELSTETIELGGRNADFIVTTRIQQRDPLLQIRGGDSMAEFQCSIKKLIIIRSFDDLPVAISGLGADFTAVMDITSANIRIEGNQSELESYKPALDAAILTLDCSGITEAGTYTLQVQADIPAAFTLIRSDPTAITIQVREQEREID